MSDPEKSNQRFHPLTTRLRRLHGLTPSHLPFSGTRRVVSEIAVEMLLNFALLLQPGLGMDLGTLRLTIKANCFCRLVIGISTFPNSSDIVTGYHQRAAVACPALIYYIAGAVETSLHGMLAYSDQGTL